MSNDTVINLDSEQIKKHQAKKKTRDSVRSLKKLCVNVRCRPLVEMATQRNRLERELSEAYKKGLINKPSTPKVTSHYFSFEDDTDEYLILLASSSYFQDWVGNPSYYQALSNVLYIRMFKKKTS